MRGKFDDAMSHLDALSKTFGLILISKIQGECKKLKVPVAKADSVETFNISLKRLLDERRKGESVFLDDVETDLV